MALVHSMPPKVASVVPQDRISHSVRRGAASRLAIYHQGNGCRRYHGLERLDLSARTTSARHQKGNV